MSKEFKEEVEDLDLSVEETKGKSIYELYGTDKAMEQQGILLNFGVYGKIKIARAGGHNQAFAEAHTRRYRPYEKQRRAGTLPEATAIKVLAEVYAETIVKGWELIGRDGKPLPCTFDTIVKVFLDLPDLFNEVRASAVEASLFREEEAEAVAGNS